MSTQHQSYYVPSHSIWPIVGAIALFFIAVGAGVTVQNLETGSVFGRVFLFGGFFVFLVMFIGWMRNVIGESMSGFYSKQIDISFRQGMSWFIFSEVMFFCAFFGALFYARMVAVPWLGGADNNVMTHEVLWPNFEAMWPLTLTPSGQTTEAMGWQGLPLLNTVILLTSSVTLHMAHTSLEKNHRMALVVWLEITIILAIAFLFYQVEEYVHAYQEMGLTLQSGIYGNTFFLLTGFHGMHVLLGTIFLSVLLARIAHDHFTPDNHFAFQAGSWYWHFVDVVWLCLFVFVYVL
ncbi:putative Cytochrome c oxidase, subunit III [Vibrio nigripulchritudo MADA3029]|uniref:cytochrome-c oxidase n=2 Tax=Vibrio nigripulchritudo TaxID=28173 RepID=U4KE45_9VIBR|nr:MULTISPECIES: cytochrome c oxidase subunit 3 [Vibrio]EGU61139.1 cytochrome c oxidase, subunit III [Vibrio nigripulchritudo ATCC 27043]KJY78859.1 MFS transporter [Vibrio nigripulchritudo]UAB72855.1 cytochrome c oxidase subunit 3 [Vibrio sp. SCSIO 43132]CCN35255.1 putative Cytochrome c oxidase, subunit III [Vibrio nigripulchritudo AM115]CCN40329.1 putative Cytochrome c oxidase, subunit III [Vibrio nigripulchritudo FTn2]